MTETSQTVHLAVTYDSDGTVDGIRTFATAEVAQSYADQRPHTSVEPHEVATVAPTVVAYFEVVFLREHHRAGLRWWATPVDLPVSPEDVRLLAATYFDDDAIPAHINNVPVGVERDDATGTLRVYGTDEQAVRRAYYDGVHEMLTAEGEARS